MLYKPHIFIASIWVGCWATMKNVSADCIELSLSPLSDIFATQSEYRRQENHTLRTAYPMFYNNKYLLPSFVISIFICHTFFFAIVVTCPNPSIWAYHLPKDHNYNYRSLSAWLQLKMVRKKKNSWKQDKLYFYVLHFDTLSPTSKQHSRL